MYSSPSTWLTLTHRLCQRMPPFRVTRRTSQWGRILEWHQARRVRARGGRVAARRRGLRERFVGALVVELGAESIERSLLGATITRGVVFADERQLRTALQQYLRYYNTTPLYSSLSYRSPLAFEH